jgi:hypothetical protein
MARTTPAQKPRGEQSTILRSGLAGMGRYLRTESPLAGGQGTANSDKDLGLVSGCVKAL